MTSFLKIKKMKVKKKKTKTKKIEYIKIPSQEEMLARVLRHAIKEIEKINCDGRQGIGNSF